MNLSNQHILHLFRWLNIPLHGEDLRTRNKFISLLEPQHEAINTKRIALLEEVAAKDEAGKAIVKDGLYEIPEEKKEEYTKVYSEYLNERADYDLSRTVNKYTLKNVLMTKLTKGLDIEEGKLFEEIVGQLE